MDLYYLKLIFISAEGFSQMTAAPQQKIIFIAIHNTEDLVGVVLSDLHGVKLSHMKPVVNFGVKLLHCRQLFILLFDHNSPTADHAIASLMLACYLLMVF